jgi:CheY-like chemotaxis protein
MPKKILFIESDSAFAAGMAEALESSGFGVRICPDGKEGVELARDWAPEAIVLCVELPRMSGYLICQKLKKDDALKGIPLVLTSAEATAETFEKHKGLKARAEEYLLKPYPPSALIAALGRLVGLPEPAEAAGAAEPARAAADEAELVSLEEELGLEAVAPEPGADLPALDLDGLPDEPSPAGAPQDDEDLKLLDDAFDGIAAPAPEPEPEPVGAAPEPALDLADEPAPGRAYDLDLGSEPVSPADLDAAAGALPDEPGMPPEPPDLDGDADRLLGALAPDGGASSAPAAFDLGLALDEEPGPAPGPSDELLAAAALLDAEEPTPAPFAPRGAAPAADPALDRALDEARSALAARDAELSALRARLAAAESRADDAEREAGKTRDAGRQRAEAAERAAAEKERERADAAERLRRLEADLEVSRREARRLGDEVKKVSEEARRGAEEARRASDEARRLGEALARAQAEAEAARAKAAEAEGAARARAAEAAELGRAAARAESLERELDETRTELVIARGEVEGARGEVEKRTGELRKRIAELEAANAKHEERIVKAYQKIKADEKVRDKARKALAIAGQLLDEGLPPESPATAAEKPRPPLPAALSRE